MIGSVRPVCSLQSKATFTKLYLVEHVVAASAAITSLRNKPNSGAQLLTLLLPPLCKSVAWQPHAPACKFDASRIACYPRAICAGARRGQKRDRDRMRLGRRSAARTATASASSRRAPARRSWRLLPFFSVAHAGGPSPRTCASACLRPRDGAL